MYTSINIIEGVIAVIKDFSIKNKQTRYFMLNNATNNNIAITAIIKEFNFNLIKYRLYYLGYIINIITRYFLYSYNLDLFKAKDIVFKDIKAQLQT